MSEAVSREPGGRVSEAVSREPGARVSEAVSREPGGRVSEALSYESAVGRVEVIIHRLDSGEAGLRETLELVKEGRDLVEFCAGELDAVSRRLEELRLDELVERLEHRRA